jgi:hypothetical protein
MNWRLNRILAILLVVVLAWNLTSCSRPDSGSVSLPKPLRGKLSLTEVSPPFAIQSLKPALEVYQPQVKILSPRSNQVLNDTEVEVKLQVKDLPLYKDEEFQLGPYIQVLLDNRPYTQLHDLSTPLKLENLTPGTHTVRALAVRPWHESFKNEGAFAQTTFHVFTPTPENNPTADQPLLTYNYPQGTYGAEPVLLDFHLLNAPLHLVAREDTKDAIPDWQIRCTINGESFTFDRWEPIYLKGFKPGKNWVQLELLDEKGKPIANAFNNTVQVITYEPGGEDTLAKLTRGELTAAVVRKIVDPNYVPPPEPVVAPEAEAEPAEPTLEAPSKATSESEELTQEPNPATMPPEILAPVTPQRTEPDSITEAKPEQNRFQPEIKPTESAAPLESEPELEPEKLPAVEPAKQPFNQPFKQPSRLIPYAKDAEEAKPPVFKPERVEPKPFEPELKSEPEVTPVRIVPDVEDGKPPIAAPPIRRIPAAQSAPPPGEVNQLNDRVQTEVFSRPKPDFPEPIQSEPVPSSIQERLKLLEKRQEERLRVSPAVPLPQPAPETEPVSQSVAPSNAPASSSVDKALPSVSLSEPLSEALSDLLSPVFAPDAASKPDASTASPLPDLMKQLDRIKDFFEGLRKPAESQPLLAPLLEDQDTALELFSTEAEPIKIPAQLEQPQG